jgi:DNA-binding transcriptional regulator YhcF (GntR family)
MRCGNLACTGKPFTEHRNIPDLRPDPADRRPEWEQVADGVRAAIRSGQLTSGDALPSVPDFARLQGLKPGTVRHAFLALADEGLVHIHHGRTTTIAAEPAADEPGTRRQIGACFHAAPADALVRLGGTANRPLYAGGSRPDRRRHDQPGRRCGLPAQRATGRRGTMLTAQST